MLDISFNYKTLFKLAIEHNFYADKPGEDLKIVLASESTGLFRKLDLITKEDAGECFFLYAPEKVEGLLNLIEKKELKLTYLLYTRNQYFSNFTDVSLENSSKIFYFSNNRVTKDNETLLLHQGQCVGDKERYSLKKEIVLLGGDKGSKFVFKNDFNQVVLVKEVAPGGSLAINNTHLPLGLYFLYENEALKDSFVLYTNVPILKPVGIIDISLTGSIKEELIDGIKSFDIPFYSYKVVFNSRSTFWKYLLISKYNTGLKNTVIDSGSGDLKFSGPQEVKLNNGASAIMFISDQPLPLKQRYDYRFQLKNVKNGSSGGKVIMDKLPFASFEMIKPESRDEKSKIFSEIIIHI